MVCEGPTTLIIFDCDGVLVDSEPLACAAEMAALAALGHPITADEFARLAIGRGRRELDPLLEAWWGRPLPEDYAERVRAATLAAFRRSLQPVAGIAALLDGLEAAPRCVASSSQPERIRLALGLTGLAPFFGEALFSAAEVARGKPAPDLFLHAARRMGAAPAACLVVEDSVPGIAAARAAGMTAVGFTAGGHCRPDLAGRLLAAGADAVAADAAALADRLASHRHPSKGAPS